MKEILFQSKKYLIKMYEIIFSKQAKKFIQSLNSKQKENIKKVIISLSLDPFSFPYKKLKNLDANYRIRVGTYRLSYSIEKNKLLIRIVKIGKRENFYN